MSYSILNNIESQVLLKFAHKTDVNKSEELTNNLIERKIQANLFFEKLIDKVKADFSNDKNEYDSGVKLLDAFHFILEKEKEKQDYHEYISNDIKEVFIDELFDSVSSVVYEAELDYGWYKGHTTEFKKIMLTDIECYKVPNEVVQTMDVKNLEFLMETIDGNELNVNTHRKMKM